MAQFAEWIDAGLRLSTPVAAVHSVFPNSETALDSPRRKPLTSHVVTADERMILYRSKLMLCAIL